MVKNEEVEKKLHQTKILRIFERNGPSVQKFFVIPLLSNLTNWLGADSNPSISYVLLYFEAKIIPKYTF